MFSLRLTLCTLALTLSCLAYATEEVKKPIVRNPFWPIDYQPTQAKKDQPPKLSTDKEPEVDLPKIEKEIISKAFDTLRINGIVIVEIDGKKTRTLFVNGRALEEGQYVQWIYDKYTFVGQISQRPNRQLYVKYCFAELTDAKKTQSKTP